MSLGRLPLVLLVALATWACGVPPTPIEPQDAGEQAPPDAGPAQRKIVSLTLVPGSLKLELGAGATLRAIATFDDRSSTDVGGTAEWEVQPGGLLELTPSAPENHLALKATALGSARVTARIGEISSAPCEVSVVAPPADPPTEARAVWVTRFAYTTAAEVEAIIDDAARAGFNVVYFQIRGNGDAYYRSQLVPWAKKLTGTLGKDPGWDPLQTAIDRAHLRGIELHAYWNVYSAWTTPPGCAAAGGCACQPAQGKADSCALPEAAYPGAPEHFLRQHPDAMAVTSGGKSVDTEYLWFSPGDPRVKAHLLAVAEELLTSYEVDGLHLDRVRYPGASYSHDPASQAAYDAEPAPKPAYDDWQRAQVTELVGELYELVRQKRPKAVLSAAVWGIYKPLPGCSTSQGYAGFYQDSYAWLREGKLDAVAPMIYWDLGTGCTDWAKLLDGFLANANGRHVVAGMHALDNGAVRPERIRARIEYARGAGAAGTAIFASSYLSGSGAWDSFRDGGPYTERARTPPMPWRADAGI